jgi:hypothetical protein
MGLWKEVKARKVRGDGAKFNKIKKQAEVELAGGKALRKQADLIEFRNRLQKEGLLNKSKKSQDAGQILGGLFQAGKQQRAPSLPADLKAQLAALGGQQPAPLPPRQLERSSGARTKTPANVREGLKAPRKTNTDDILDDISRIMRGESPQKLQIASAGDELGIRARQKPTSMKQLESEERKLKSELERVLGSRASEGLGLGQLRERAAQMANELSGSLPPSGQTSRYQARLDKIDSLLQRVDAFTAKNASATGNTKWARVDAQDFDRALGPVRREGSKSYAGWEGSHGSGARKIGEGAYGTVIRNPDGTFVKRGAISDTEADLIRRLGEADLGPKLKAADINGPHEYNKERFVDIRNGRIAMGEVPGQPIGRANADTKFGGNNAADVYWKAMADLHRMGIAHNDAHIDNILVDNNGKGRWVDLGLAQASPKAALAEAMGVFPVPRGANPDRVMGAAGQGNWQGRRWDGTGVRQAEAAKAKGGQTWSEFQQKFPIASRIWDNSERAQNKLLDIGLNQGEVASIIDHGIRSPIDTYTKGPWSRLTDQQAQDVLNTLYDGI